MPPIVYETLRVVVAVAGALIAWFVIGPLARGLTRLAFQRSLPQGGQVVARIAGGVGTGVLIYLFFTLGPGWGPGGGGSGTGNGTGDGKGPGISGTDKPKDNGTDKTTTDKSVAATDKNGKQAHPDWLLIEVVGGHRYPGKGQYYLLRRKEPADLQDVEAFLKEKKRAFKEIHIVLTDDTHGGAASKLRNKLDELMSDRSYGFMVRTKDERKKRVSSE